jgi:hypothetical protein
MLEQQMLAAQGLLVGTVSTQDKAPEKSAVPCCVDGASHLGLADPARGAVRRVQIGG